MSKNILLAYDTKHYVWIACKCNAAQNNLLVLTVFRVSIVCKEPGWLFMIVEYNIKQFQTRYQACQSYIDISYLAY